MGMEIIKLQLRVSVNCSKIYKALNFVFIQISNLLTSQVQTSKKEANMTALSKKLYLNWNDFQKTISSTFREMRVHQDLADVTLACEDNTQFQAHKFVLSTSSSLSTKLLREKKHPHSLNHLIRMKASAQESMFYFV